MMWQFVHVFDLSYRHRSSRAYMFSVTLEIMYRN